MFHGGRKGKGKSPRASHEDLFCSGRRSLPGDFRPHLISQQHVPRPGLAAKGVWKIMYFIPSLPGRKSHGEKGVRAGAG